MSLNLLLSHGWEQHKLWSEDGGCISDHLTLGSVICDDTTSNTVGSGQIFH